MSPNHIEDMSYREAVAPFPIDINALRESHRQRLEELRQQQDAAVLQARPELAKHEPLAEDPQGKFYLHTVRPTDTLAGICIRYNVQRTDVMRSNPRMIGERFSHLAKLNIPKVPGFRGPAPEDESAIRVHKEQDFLKATKCGSIEEARYYLGETNYDLDAALKLFASDQP